MPTIAPAATTVESERIFKILREGREDDRNSADRLINDPGHPMDRTDLRRRLLECLRDNGTSGKPLRSTDRAWLIYSLGRVADGDAASLDLIRQSLTPTTERDNRWLRYWALAGLARGRDPQTIDIARQVLAAAQTTPDENQVTMVAVAILAATGERASLQRLRDAIDSQDPNDQWPALRALRVVTIDDDVVVRAVVQIVERGDNSDITYDSIRALHHVAVDSPYARTSARALERFVEDWRTFPGRDAMRAQALIGIGKLRSVRSVAVLTEELLDPNPTIVREAAVSLERILDAPRAVARVLEAARGRPETWQAYARALRWMENQQGVTDELGEMMGSSDIEQEEACRELLRSMGGSMAFEKLRAKANLLASHQKFVADSEKRMNDLFETTIGEAQKGFHWVTVMDRIVFGLGLGLIVTSATMSLFNTGEFEKYVTAGSGALAVLYSMFFSKPRQQVEDAVANLMRLKIVFLGYLHQLRQADQAYQRHMLEEKPVAPEDVEKFRTIIANCIEKASAHIRAGREPA